MAEAFLYGNGGDNPLNFKVVGGTSEPSNPKENMIWVNTNTAITSYIFSTTQPTGTAGMVWFRTGKSSTAVFNALKKNNIQIYPASAKQYVSGTWVEKTAKSYQGGKWVDWVEQFYLQKGSAIHVAVTNDKVGTMVTNTSSVSYKFEQYTGNYWHFGPVDMTNYKILHVDVVGGSVFGYPKPGICVFPNKISSHQTTNITFFGGTYNNATCTVPKQTIAMDISAYSGNKYVILDFEGTNTKTGYVEISNIYLEN